MTTLKDLAKRAYQHASGPALDRLRAVEAHPHLGLDSPAWRGELLELAIEACGQHLYIKPWPGRVGFEIWSCGLDGCLGWGSSITEALVLTLEHAPEGMRHTRKHGRLRARWRRDGAGAPVMSTRDVEDVHAAVLERTLDLPLELGPFRESDQWRPLTEQTLGPGLLELPDGAPVLKPMVVIRRHAGTLGIRPKYDEQCEFVFVWVTRDDSLTTGLRLESTVSFSQLALTVTLVKAEIFPQERLNVGSHG